MDSSDAIRNTKILDESHKIVKVPTYKFADLWDDLDKNFSPINRGCSCTVLPGVEVSGFRCRTGLLAWKFLEKNYLAKKNQSSFKNFQIHLPQKLLLYFSKNALKSTHFTFLKFKKIHKVTDLLCRKTLPEFWRKKIIWWELFFPKFCF